MGYPFSVCSSLQLAEFKTLHSKLQYMNVCCLFLALLAVLAWTTTTTTSYNILSPICIKMLIGIIV